MKRIFIFFLLAGCFLSLRAQSRVDEIRRDLMARGKFSEALAELDLYRPDAPYKFPVDILRCVCMCKLGLSDKGKQILLNIISKYKLTPEYATYVDRALEFCNKSGMPDDDLMAFALRITNRGSGGGRVEGKGGVSTRGNAGSKSIVSQEKPEKLEIDPKILEARLLKIGGIPDLEKHLSTFMPQADVPYTAVTGSMIFYCLECDNQKTLDRYSVNQEAIKKWIGNTYGLEQPPYYLTQFITASRGSLYYVANALHRVFATENTHGYSVVADMSMVVRDAELYGGTSAHEITHQLLNFNYPYLPPFLAEGLPALYETVQWKNNMLIPADNWRLKVLKELKEDEGPALLPLDTLLRMDWMEFDRSYGFFGVQSPGASNSPLSLGQIPSGTVRVDQQVVNHSMARYFMIYLFEEGVLVPVVKDICSATDPMNEKAGAETPVQIIERHLQSDVETIEVDFLTWLALKTK